MAQDETLEFLVVRGEGACPSNVVPISRKEAGDGIAVTLTDCTIITMGEAPEGLIYAVPVP